MTKKKHAPHLILKEISIERIFKLPRAARSLYFKDENFTIYNLPTDSKSSRYKGFATARTLAKKDAEKLQKARGLRPDSWSDEEWREYLIHFGYCLAQQEQEKEKIDYSNIRAIGEKVK